MVDETQTQVEAAETGERLQTPVGHYRLTCPEGMPLEEFDSSPDVQIYQESLNMVSVAKSWAAEAEAKVESGESVEEEIDQIVVLFTEYGQVAAKMRNGSIDIEEGAAQTRALRENLADSLQVDRWPEAGWEEPAVDVEYRPFAAEAPIAATVLHDVKNVVSRVDAYYTLARDFNDPNYLNRIPGEMVGLPQSMDRAVQVIEEGREPKRVDIEGLWNKWRRKAIAFDINMGECLAAHLEEIPKRQRPRLERFELRPDYGELPAELGNEQVVAAEPYLESVLENCISNAAKAVLEAEQGAEEPVFEFQVRYRKVGDALEIAFIDNGTGTEGERVDFAMGESGWDQIGGSGTAMGALAEILAEQGIDLYRAQREDGQRGTEVIMRITVIE